MHDFLKDRILVLCCAFIVILFGNAQEKKDATQNLINSYKNYFSTPRKSIHLHLNKTTHISGEQIWLSTYVYNKKENAISLEEEYIHINLINDFGEIIASKTVLYSRDRGFTNILLAPYLPSGDYFLQAYTTAMQGFIEDDSAIYKIKVLNYEDDISSLTNRTAALGEIQIEIQAESGQLLEGVLGTCAIRITDSDKNPVIPDKVLLKSSNDSNTSDVSINEIGMGRFSLIMNTNEQYQIEAHIGDKVYTEKVPLAKNSGYTISVDYNYGHDLLLVSVNTNTKNLEQNLSLLVHKDGNLLNIPVSLNNNETTAEIILPYSMLYKGVNTLSLLKNGRVLAERLVFAYPENNTLTAKLLNIELEKDSMVVFIKYNSRNLKSAVNRLSVSVLPENSLSDIELQNVPSSFFLSGNIPNETISQLQKSPFIADDAAKYMLDNALMLKSRGRYQWKNISNPSLFPSEKTTNLSRIDGYVNLFDAKNDSLTVKLFSAENGLFETTLLSAEKKFCFNDLILAKDSKFSLTLINKKGKPIYGNFFFTTIPEKVTYRHHYVPNPKNKSVRKSNSASNENPFFKKVEKLENVTVSANELKFEKFFGEFDGRKVDSTLMARGDLENHIRSYGFQLRYIETNHPNPKIAGTRQFMKICKGSLIFSPMVVVDGVFDYFAMNYGYLRLEYIDEIYYKSGCPALFVVITNENYKNRPVPESKKNAKEFIVKNGHHASWPFIRPEYYTKTNRSFEYFGIISWLPKIISDDQGVITFKIPNDGQQKLKLQLQGFSEDGDLISDELFVDLSKGK